MSLIESRQAADERFSTLADTVSTMEPEFDADTSTLHNGLRAHAQLHPLLFYCHSP